MTTRIETLISKMPQNFEAALITQQPSRFYLLNLDTSDAGMVLVTRDESYFIIDSRYIEVAEKNVTSATVVLEKKPLEQVYDILTKHGIKSLCLENTASLAFAATVAKAMPDITLDTSSTLADTLDEMRVIKDESEIAAITMAQKITDDCFEYILGIIKPGMREIDLALQMEVFMRSHGAQKLAFPTIFVAGAKTSLPHGEPDENVIKDGDFITMDFGANYNGYCADMTRTVAVGSISDKQKNVYDTVLAAQLKACAGIKAGMKGDACDAIARDVINAAGYEGKFGHGLGHSLGIEIHENPRFSPAYPGIIPCGAVMSIEPGIYLAGEFGVRIEDTVLVRENDVQILAKSDKNLIIIH